MPRFEHPKELREEARRLHKGGATYKSIATALGVSRQTVRCWCDDAARKDNNRRAHKWSRTTERGRVNGSIQSSKATARKHGGKGCITPVDEILAHPQIGCEICGGIEPPNGKRLYLDHDHETGEFRGWLCMRCNSGIGMLRDSPELLIKAANYLTPS